MIAMGGIGSKPWRNVDAEAALEGKLATRDHFESAAQIILSDAKPQSQNGFKIEFARRCLVHALSLVTQAG